MRALAGFLFDHRRAVVAVWLLVLISLIGVARAVGPDYRFDINISGSDSLEAFDILERHQDAPGGEQITIIWEAPGGVNNPEAREAVETVLAKIATLPDVARVGSPFQEPAGRVQVAANGDIAFATVEMAQDSLSVPRESVRAVVNVAKTLQDAGITVGLSGQSVGQTSAPSTTASEALGLGFAAIVLVLAFGSVIAAGLPLAGALVALGASLSVVTLLTRVFAIPIFAPQLVALIGIGVGIDYALFVVSRHRSGLLRGMAVRESVLHAMDTSGRAVIFAGITVMISILGLLVVGIGFLNGLAFATSIAVLFTMLVAITLMPAMLGFLGDRVLGRRARRRLREEGAYDDEQSGLWVKWSAAIQRRPVVFIALSTAILLVLAIPVASMRLGSADASTDPQGSVTRVAYDLRSEGFGAGANGPLLLVTREGQAASLDQIVPTVKAHPNVAAVTPVATTPDGEVAFVTVIPKSGPQDVATEELIQDLRQEVLPSGPDKIYVSGITAVFSDFADDLRGKLPWFLLGVLGLSSLLLLVAFQSLAIPLKAALMNLVAAAASFGVLTAIFQWGWFAGPLGVEGAGPIDAFLPIMLLAILFGLSMDYQVFLVSRMKEEWDRLGDNAEAVRLGLSETGRVITAAALIMIFVFAAFIFGGQRIIQIFGVGLAAAIFIDAFIIRSLLVPALMQVLGRWNWWLPEGLRRRLPKLTV